MAVSTELVWGTVGRSLQRKINRHGLSRLTQSTLYFGHRTKGGDKTYDAAFQFLYMPDALDDVTVLSFAQLAQGPMATQMLADFGAEVVKIERPETGEWMRDWSMANTFLEGESVVWLSANRNKKSVEMDLKDEDDLDAIYSLVEEVDVIVENFRPGVMDRLDLGYENLTEMNPELVYCSASGWGSEGPYADRPGQDLIIQGATGFMDITGQRDHPPTPFGTTVVDYYSAAILAFGIMVALYYREQTGRGQKVEGDLLSAAISMLSQEVAVYRNTGEEPERSESGVGHVYNPAPYGVYETADGHLVLSLSKPAAVGEALGIKSIQDVTSWDEAYERRDDLKRTIEEELSEESTEHWLSELWEHDIWCGPVNDLGDALLHPQVEANEMIESVTHPEIGQIEFSGIPLKLSRTPGEIKRHPPILGEHNQEIRNRIKESREEN